jgi:hypothetical protein
MKSAGAGHGRDPGAASATAGCGMARMLRIQPACLDFEGKREGVRPEAAEHHS